MKVILASDDKDILGFLESISGMDISQAKTKEEVMDVINKGRPDVLILSDRVPGGIDLIELVQWVNDNGVRVIFQADKFAEDQVTLRCIRDRNCTVIYRDFNFAELENVLFGRKANNNPAASYEKRTPKKDIPKRIIDQLSLAKTKRNPKSRKEKPVNERQLPNLTIVYSPVSAGKTFTAVNLAAYKAQAGNKVSLLDLDILQPSVGSCLNIPADKEVLSEAMLAPGHPGYQLRIPNGLTVFATAPERAPVIDHSNLYELLSTLSRAYDLVIVDTPRDMDTYNLGHLLTVAGRIIIVGDLDYSRLITLHRRLKVLGNLIDYDKVSLVANRVTENKKVTIADLEKAVMDVPCQCVIPDIPARVLEGIYAGKPPVLFVPELSVFGDLLGSEELCRQEIS